MRQGRQRGRGVIDIAPLKSDSLVYNGLEDSEVGLGWNDNPRWYVVGQFRAVANDRFGASQYIGTLVRRC